MTTLKQSMLTALTGAGILLGGAGMAQADQTAPETQSFAVQQSTGTGVDFPPTEILTFAGFNAGLGILTGVAVTLSTGGDSGGFLTVSMTGGEGFGPPVDSAFNARQTNMSATGPSGLSFTGSMSGLASCSANLDGFCSNSASMDVSTSQNGTQNVISPNLAPFMLSTFDINVALGAFFDGSADQTNCATTNVGGRNPSCTGSADALWQGDISVVYSYATSTPAPEPATLALLAGSLGALGMTRRRRR
jgi:hypothetical protein